MPSCILHGLLIHSVAWSTDLVESPFGPTLLQCFHQETQHGPVELSSEGISCLQGKLAPIVHSLCGHILWTMAAPQWMILGVESCCHPLSSDEVQQDPNHACSYKLTTTRSLDYQSALGQTPLWGILPPYYEVHLIYIWLIAVQSFAVWSALLRFLKPYTLFGRSLQLTHHVHSHV